MEYFDDMLKMAQETVGDFKLIKGKSYWLDANEQYYRFTYICATVKGKFTEVMCQARAKKCANALRWAYGCSNWRVPLINPHRVVGARNVYYKVEVLTEL